MILKELLSDIINQYNIKIKGILHIGAHECEELEIYKKLGVNENNIIWIEAIKEKCIKNKNNGIKNVFNYLITNSDNKITSFNIANNYQSSSILNLHLHKKYHPSVKMIKSINIESITINKFFKENNINNTNYNFWNLDIQGAELLALKGAGDILENVDILYLEVNNKEVYKDCCLVTDLDTYLSNYNFKRIHTQYWNDVCGWGDAIFIKI